MRTLPGLPPRISAPMQCAALDVLAVTVLDLFAWPGPAAHPATLKTRARARASLPLLSRPNGV